MIKLSDTFNVGDRLLDTIMYGAIILVNGTNNFIGTKIQELRGKMETIFTFWKLSLTTIYTYSSVHLITNFSAK